MTEWVAFIRSINVGGHNRIKMTDLRQIFIDAGAKLVKSVGASGNIKFHYDNDIASLVTEVQPQLLKVGKKVFLFVRKFQWLENLLNSDQFGSEQPSDGIKRYISIVNQRDEDAEITFPYTTDDGITLLKQYNGDILAIRDLSVKRGVSPNKVVEDLTGSPATSRDWNTLLKLYDK